MSTKTYKFTPAILNGAGDWQYIEGGDRHGTSLRKGFSDLASVAEDGSTVKVVAYDGDNEVASRTCQIHNGKHGSSSSLISPACPASPGFWGVTTTIGDTPWPPTPPSPPITTAEGSRPTPPPREARRIAATYRDGHTRASRSSAMASVMTGGVAPRR